MKKKLITILLGLSLLTQCLPVQAKALTVEDYESPKKIRCTCYVGGTVTATGKTPHFGIVAGPRDWFGCAVAVYRVNEDGSKGEFIAWFEVDDTGPNELLLSGKAIDLWQPTLEDANAWIKEYGDYVYIQLIRAEG